MLLLYGPLTPKVIFILLKCSNGKQPDFCLMIFQDLPVSSNMLERLGGGNA